MLWYAVKNLKKRKIKSIYFGLAYLSIVKFVQIIRGFARQSKRFSVNENSVEWKIKAFWINTPMTEVPII